MIIMHHRYATVGEVNIQNAHPFEWKHFYLMQNGTAKAFHNKYKTTHWQDVDSHNLLLYIESKTSSIEEVPEVLKEISEEVKESLGNIIIVERDTWTILFYTDWARESYIEFKGSKKLKQILNYSPTEKKWFSNKGYLICRFDFSIIKNTFQLEKVNKDKFYPYFSDTYSYFTPATSSWVDQEWDDYENTTYNSTGRVNNNLSYSSMEAEKNDIRDYFDNYASYNLWDLDGLYSEYILWYYWAISEKELYHTNYINYNLRELFIQEWNRRQSHYYY